MLAPASDRHASLAAEQPFEGAATGAAAGGLMGGMRRADSGAQQQQWAQQEAANYQRNRDEWTRGFSACMRSRGYTVG